MKPRIITGTLVAVILVLQIVSLLALIRATQVRLQDQARQSALHDLETKSKRLANQSQQFLTPVTAQLAISRQLIADGFLDAAQNEDLELYFLSQLRSNTSINAMYLGRYDSSFVAVARFEHSRRPDYEKPVLRAKLVSMQNNVRAVIWREYALNGDRLSQWTDDNDQHDPRVRAWYLNALGHDQPVWTNTFSLTGSQKLAIAASVNLRDKSKVDAGVLGLSVELSALSSLVSDMFINQSDTAFILDNNFNEIAASDSHVNPASESLKRNLHAVENNMSMNSSNQVYLPPVEQVTRRLANADAQWFSDDGRRANVERRLVLFGGALQWRVVLQAPVLDVAWSEKALVLDGMYRTIIVVILSGVLSLFIIFGFSEPLQRLYRRATVDFLTGAFNREEFLSRFSRRLDRGRSHRHESLRWAVVALDLDGFKQINDRHGHDAGDMVLQAVAARLQQCVGQAGFVGRLGGDEFALALRLPQGADARLAVERIRRSVVMRSVRSARAIHTIAMTAGVSEVQENDPVNVALERADSALVAGKVIEKDATYIASAKTVTKTQLATRRNIENRPVLQGRVMVKD